MQVRVPALVRVVSPLDKFQVIGLEPDSDTRAIVVGVVEGGCSYTSARQGSSKVSGLLLTTALPHVLLNCVIVFLAINSQLQIICPCEEYGSDARIWGKLELGTA